MNPDELIPASQFCEHHHIEFSFIQALGDYGLIEIILIQEQPYISLAHLKNTEQMMRLHYDLDINMEGIDAITHLLQKVDSMQKELTVLKNRLTGYEY